MTIDREMLMAYADGELDAMSAKRMEKAMVAQPELAEQVAAHRALRATLANHFAPVIDAPLPERLMTLLDDTVVPFRVAPQRLFSFQVKSLAAIAAALVIGLMLGQTIPFGVSAPVGSQEGRLVAQGDLVRALDTQLASTQSGDAPTRVGLTFRDREGQVCRTFDGAALSGIACHVAGTWNLKRTVAREEQETPAYRQAGSADMMEAAQRMMAGDPMDADAERKAMDSDWE
ncbi:MAG: hypothetical protein A3H25_13930 [Sphingomonadales bacterium RIFCSPLOWO2_12_FULL_63_15]|nr:MAG: hypothetical protein A3H25_13930 [Sphingomonadales bacterium RIFCSPLOWO2_12_FULL_63_15]